MPPQTLRDRRQWLVWKFEKDAKHPEKTKLLKVPYYTTGSRRHGEVGTESDRRKLATYEAAVKAAPPAGLEVGCGGIGFAFLPGDGLIGIDLDGMIDLATGEIRERAVRIIKACASYTEYSPSGKGVHIIAAGETITNKSNDIGVEIFCGRQYFTFSDKHYSGAPAEIRPLAADVLVKLHALVDRAKEEGKKRRQAAAAPARPPSDGSNDFARVNDAAMQNLPAWVPSLLPSAVSHGAGYRVSSASLGRELEEDLSITPKGIVDWGVADMGDSREGRRTPIDLVMEHGHKKTGEALHWLAAQLGIDVGSPRTPRRGKRQPGPDGPPGDEPPPAGGDDGDGEDRRPTIKWIQGDLPQIVEEAEQAIIESGLRIYQRAGYLVRVVRRDTPSVRHYKRRPPGALGIVTVDAPYLTESFTRAAYWQKWNAKAKDPGKPDGPPGMWLACNAPEQVAVTYLARRGHWQLPRLWSAISSPTLRPDGTVLQDPGYDEPTQSWYDPCGIQFPKIPESPTHYDAEEALKVFSKAFDSFPFDSKADRSVALALALTALVRRSLPSAPLGGITAPVMASGKTLLADCIAILATGVSAPAMKYADTDEEATKTMLAVLAEGDQVVLIDNVERPLEGDTLCAVLTSEAYRQRVLGRTEMMSVPTTTLFLATGNHLVIAGDLRTRALMCRIDPKTEHPEQRQFTTELREWITIERPKLVAAGLTILRAFIATGQNPQDMCSTWGRFERWSDMVRAPLIWLGCEDPCASLADLAKEDPERIELVRAILSWEAVFADEGYTAREAIERVLPSDDGYGPTRTAAEQSLHLVLREICKDRDGSLNPKKLGHWLRTHADRITEKKRFVRAGERDHTLLWKVETLGTSSPAPLTGGGDAALKH